MITVLGKLPDTAPYIGKAGYNVYPASDDWTPEKGRVWLSEAVRRGDDFLLVSSDFSGAYLREIGWLQDEAQKLRWQAASLQARAVAINEAVRRAKPSEPVRRVSLTDDEIFAGCVDPRTWQPEQGCVSG